MEDLYKQQESSARQHYDLMQHQERMDALVEQSEHNLFAMLKPKIYKDGKEWCVLLGDNIQEGVCGFGDSPHLAILDFNANFYKKEGDE